MGYFTNLHLMYQHKLLLSLAVGLLAALTLPSPAQTYGDDVVCYFSSWARWRPGNGMFDVEDIDPFLCTHAIFSFAGLSNVTWELEVLDPWNELCPEEEGGYYCAFDRFTALKEINPDLVVLLAVGGWREGSEDYSVMAADPSKRKSFINSAIYRMYKHGFDGLDMDWEYPTARGGAPEDRANFVLLMQEFRAAFDKMTNPLMLTFAAAAGKDVIDEAYDVSQLVPLVDKWHVMAYDYHGAWENFTHHHATLCGYYLDPEEFQTFNVKFTAEYYVSLGVPKDKMVVGIATYGRCWTLESLDNTGIYANAIGPGPAGPYIQIPGTLGFNEICEKLLADDDDDCVVVNDPNLLEPYFYCRSDKVWCSYDDGDSVYTKARYARNLGLAGVLVWQIDTDDFQPFCYSEPFHLIRQMKRALQEPAGGDELVCPNGSITSDSVTYSTTAYTTTHDYTTSSPDTTPPDTTLPDTTLPDTTLPDTTLPDTTLPDTTTPDTTLPDTTLPDTTTPDTTPSRTTPALTDTTTISISTTTRHPSIRPDCTGLPDGTTFPHSDCNKYWECVNEVGILELCSPGTVWDDGLKVCNWEDQVDTSNCYTWVCSVDNTYYPHADCDKYYWCYQGSPHEEQCPDGNYWSQELTQCVRPSDADTSKCNIP
uniref:Chitinase 4 n=1 Tax=Eriocheir sinensis TaxID=95602 RepID=A0A0H4LUS7_ERISI|nr:chitinase 4 [Eriocheir sinensis]